MNRSDSTRLRVTFSDPELQAPRLRVVIHNKGQAEAERINVAVVDDDPNDRLLLQRALNRSDGFRCVGCFASGEEALDSLPSTRLHAVLMDVRMPSMSGISCVKRLRQILPSLTIIMITVMPELNALKESLLAGADGFLDKAASDLECCEAIRYALAGGLPLAKTLGAKLASMLAAQKPSTLLRSLLSGRECAVMECIACGLPNKQIADKVGLSVYMVKYEARRIYTKLGAANRPAAVSRWRSHIG